MYYSPHRIHRRRPLDFILPFLIIICVGVVAVLAVQLYFTLTDKPMEDKINVYVASGSARFLPWGMSNWQNVYSGMNLLPGDAIRTSKEGRTVLRFFNDSVVRVAPNTEIILQETKRDDVSDSVFLALNSGEIWVNVKSLPGMTSNFSIRTKNLLIKNAGTVFDVLNDSLESIRVIKGEVSADVIAYEDSEERVLDTIEIGIGQEVSLSSKNIEAFKARKTVSALAAVSDDFEDSEWYKWNIAEDITPTDFVSEDAVESEVADKVSVKPLEVSEQDDDEFEDIEPPRKPVILEPKEGAREIEEGSVAISGTTDGDTEKIIIELGSERYTLSKYVPGSLTWKYVLSESYGNLKPGGNKYLVYAEDKAGNRSEPSEITLNYKKLSQDELGEFTAPIVVSYNGSLSNEVSEAPVTIKGKVSGAVSVVVNDYVLSGFKPGDKEWIYYLKEQYGNLLPGFNEYKVYSVDASGNKSEVSKFQVIYKKAGVSTSTYTSEP